MNLPSLALPICHFLSSCVPLEESTSSSEFLLTNILVFGIKSKYRLYRSTVEFDAERVAYSALMQLTNDAASTKTATKRE